jgi:hypothetical protein
MTQIAVVGGGIVLCVALGVGALAATGQMRVEKPLKVEVCELQANPATYDHKLIEVTGVVSHGFEKFSLSDARCAQRLGVWLEYGGTARSGTVYCCGVTADRTRPEALVVEGISVPLIDDAIFRQFDTRIQSGRELVLHATLVGRFFAGRQERSGGGDVGGGYGHLGCCSLLAIQQVLAIASGSGG